MREKLEMGAMIGVLAVLVILVVSYGIWQYHLCMHLIGGFWYCLQHAG